MNYNRNDKIWCFYTSTLHTHLYCLFVVAVVFVCTQNIYLFIVVFTCWFLFIVFMNNFSIVIWRHSLLLYSFTLVGFLNCNKFFHWVSHKRKNCILPKKVYCFYTVRFGPYLSSLFSLCFTHSVICLTSVSLLWSNNMSMNTQQQKKKKYDTYKRIYYFYCYYYCH